MRAGPVTLLLAVAVVSSGCMDAARVNSTCTWTDGPARPLDLGRREDREHLRVDAKVAGELGVRLADQSHRGVSDLWQPIFDRCRSAMIDSIAQRHGVTRADIDRAVLDRVWWADFLVVFLPMALLTWFAMDRIAKRICRSFDPEDLPIARISLGFFIIAASALAVGVTQFWGFSVEGWMLRNSHVSFRAFEVPATRHGWLTFIGALTIATMAGVRRFRATPLSRPPRPFTRAALGPPVADYRDHVTRVPER